MSISGMRKLLKQARSQRSAKRAIGNLLAALREADRIRFSIVHSEGEKKEAYFVSEYVGGQLMDWAARSGVQKWEINGVVESCLREDEEEVVPKPVAKLTDDIEALFPNPPTDWSANYLTIRVLNAMFKFSKWLEEDRKSGKALTWYAGYPVPKTVGDLTKWTKARLLGIKDMGRKSVAHLESALNEAGYQLTEGILQREFREKSEGSSAKEGQG